MTEKISTRIDVFSLNTKNEIQPAVDAVMNGKITMLRVGSVFGLVFNPGIAGLQDKLNTLKGRKAGQLMSVVCTYEQAKQIVDKDRVNQDFFRISAYLCSKVITRIPVDPATTLPFQFNCEDETLQFLSFEQAHPIRNAFAEELNLRGCKFIAITSGNISGMPTIEDTETAKMLAALFNVKASFLGMPETKTVVTEIPEDRVAHRGSYIILSFCNREAIEVKRLANKTDRDVTERYIQEL